MGERPRLNDLDGRTWTRYSISVWDDIRREEQGGGQGHPAAFPVELARRLIRIFTHPEESVILDPFVGSGSTPVAAVELGASALGLDLSAGYLQRAAERLQAAGAVESDSTVPPGGGGRWSLIQGDASTGLSQLPAECVDLCITSPPYWNILKRRRSADGKEQRDYGDDPADLGTIDEYDAFLDSAAEVFAEVHRLLRPGCFCAAVVMDLRKKAEFYPLHMDLARRCRGVGFTLDDLIIWDRRHEYNNLRPLGYPSVFRVNKVHEFILLLQKR